MDDRVVILPGKNIREVVLDPLTGKVLVMFVDGTIIVIDGEHIIFRHGKTEARFKSFEEFQEFVQKNSRLTVIKGGLDS